MHNRFSDDAAFDSLYSLRAQQLSSIHWTPVDVAKRAAFHLTGGAGKNILDIGSGVGKFCLIAAHYFPEHIFHGIEQRETLVNEAIIAQKASNILNVNFTHGNFTEIDLELYDHFYFYNSFSENLFHYKPIDNLIPTSDEIHDQYQKEFYQLLDAKKTGTRLATYYCPDGYVPPDYKLFKYTSGDPLKLWIKQ